MWLFFFSQRRKISWCKSICKKCTTITQAQLWVFTALTKTSVIQRLLPWPSPNSGILDEDLLYLLPWWRIASSPSSMFRSDVLYLESLLPLQIWQTIPAYKMTNFIYQEVSYYFSIYILKRLSFLAAVVNKLIKEIVPNIRVSTDARDLLLNCCTGKF